MFPGILFLLPLFVIFVNLERSTGVALYGTRLGLIITDLTFSAAVLDLDARRRLRLHPARLNKAALVDGSIPLGGPFRILIPVARPGSSRSAIFAFITAWGEVLFASILTTDATRTLAIGLRNYASQSNVYGTSSWPPPSSSAPRSSSPSWPCSATSCAALTAGGVK